MSSTGSSAVRSTPSQAPPSSAGTTGERDGIRVACGPAQRRLPDVLAHVRDRVLSWLVL